jgi:hypothetical protein
MYPKRVHLWGVSNQLHAMPSNKKEPRILFFQNSEGNAEMLEYGDDSEAFFFFTKTSEHGYTTSCHPHEADSIELYRTEDGDGEVIHKDRINNWRDLFSHLPMDRWPADLQDPLQIALNDFKVRQAAYTTALRRTLELMKPAVDKLVLEGKYDEARALVVQLPAEQAAPLALAINILETDARYEQGTR